MTDPIDGPRLGPSTGAATELVVILHGYGANGDDLFPLAEAWQPLFPGAAFVVPHAPDVCGQVPFGREWFPLARLDPASIAAGVAAAAPGLNAFLDAELVRLGLTNDRLAVVGFSQGAMMALDVGLRRAPAIAGILAYSGLLARPVTAPGPGRSPVLLHHGASDTVVPPASLGIARAALESAGIPVESHMRPGLGHGIDDTALHLGARFLTRILRATGAG